MEAKVVVRARVRRILFSWYAYCSIPIYVSGFKIGIIQRPSIKKSVSFQNGLFFVSGQLIKSFFLYIFFGGFHFFS